MVCPPGQKKVAVVERWPLGKVPQYKRWLYILLGMLANELSVTGRFANVMAPIVRTLDSAVYAPDKSQSGRYVYQGDQLLYRLDRDLSSIDLSTFRRTKPCSLAS